MPGQELSTAGSVGRYSVAERARGAYDEGQVDLIKHEIMPPDSSDGELAIFLETCIRNDFDPFIKEIWAIKYRNKVQPVVSVDGLRKKANQSADFKGCSSQVIHEHDLFAFRYEEREDETSRVVVTHEPRDSDGLPTHGGPDGSGRGGIIGAWARVRRVGDDDVFFIAYSKEYDKSSQGAQGAVWKAYPHAMIQKAAESVALRKAFNISGVVGEGELSGDRSTLTSGSGGAPEINWPEDEELTANLKKGFEVLGYTQAKVRMRVNACETTEDFVNLLNELSREVDAGAPTDDDAPEVADAEVVDEPAPAA